VKSASPSLETSLIVVGVASITAGVALFDVRAGLIAFGVFCFLGLLARLRWGL